MTSSPVFLSIKNVAYNLQRIRIIKYSEFHSQNRMHLFFFFFFYSGSASLNMSDDSLLLVSMQFGISLIF